MAHFVVRFLGPENMEDILPFAQHLNPTKPRADLRAIQEEMFSYTNYHCFGIWEGDQLRGMSSAWTSTKFYSGKQLEVDNYVIDESQRSQGLGKLLMDHISNWAKENHYQTIELNAYVHNHRGHKFYINQGFDILGYHFLKKLTTNE